MAECNHCGSFVSTEFARVFADNDGRIHACLECANKAGIAQTMSSRFGQMSTAFTS